MVASVLGWSTNAFHLLCVLALLLAVALYAKRIGGFGPWLVGAVAFIDAALSLAYLLFSITTRFVHLGWRMVDQLYSALSVVDILLTIVCSALAIAGFAMMRRPPVRP